MLNPRRRRRDEGGQNPPKIQLGAIMDFPALTEQSEPWPKTNDFGHPPTVKKLAITPGVPFSLPYPNPCRLRQSGRYS